MPDLFFSAGYVLLGVIAMLLGKYLPKRFLMPQMNRYIVTDEKRYMKVSRGLLYILGFYYIALGIVDYFVKNEPAYMMYFKLGMLSLFLITSLFIQKKYFRHKEKVG